MLSVMALAALDRVSLSGSRVLMLAAAGVIALDPWAVMSLGCWLSFAAVAVLGHVASRARRFTAPSATPSRWRSWAGRCREGVRIQLIMTLALMPPLAFAVQQVSLASPFANVVAIPMVSALVTPLALLCALACAVPGGQAVAGWIGMAGELLFRACMVPVAWLGERDWAGVAVGAAPLGWLLVALAGVVWAIQAPGMPGRRLAWLLMAPMLFWRPSRPEPGDWRLTALDVGQAGAVVVETATQTLVFDTGMEYANGSDAGESVVWPYLRARAIHRVDTLVVSHAHLDHVGGVRGVLAHLPVRQAYASFDLPGYLQRERRPLHLAGLPPMPAEVRRCVAGVHWQVDGVRFSFLHPAVAAPAFPKDPNASSCVLLVQGKRHAFVLPGDIGRQQEQLIVAFLPQVDLVLAGHHGSARSSSPRWIEATRASHVIAQAGHANHFGHPARAVQRRWADAEAAFWRTDLDGAVMAQSAGATLTVWAQRDVTRRYWHAVLTP